MRSVALDDGRTLGSIRRERPASETPQYDRSNGLPRLDRPEVTRYSHSIVAGGFDVTSSTTRLTAGISFTMREEIVSISS
jgi:hypothetical protein